MALRLRLRGALSLSSSLLHHSLRHQPKPISTISSHHLLSTPTSRTTAPSPPQLARPFTSTASLFRKSFDPQTEEIGPDDILFEGCDYKHWLITVDFPRDQSISREQMIETYVDIAAQVFGSVEEAKKKIYALSTTIYQGFQVECSEETSDKFKSLPGVVFVLPDSYIDPTNKEYGGDKYINGEIIPRPPPVQYGRRHYERRPQYGPPPQQNYGTPPQQNYGAPPQQNYGAPPQQNHGAPPHQSYGSSPRQDYGTPARQDFRTPRRQDYGPAPPQDYQSPPQQNYTPRPRPSYGSPPQQTHVAPPQQQSYGNASILSSQLSYNPPGLGERRGYVPPTGDSGHGERNPTPSYQGNFNQVEYGNDYAQRQRDFQQGNRQSHVSPGHRGFQEDASYGSSQGGGFEQVYGGHRNFSSTENN